MLQIFGWRDSRDNLETQSVLQYTEDQAMADILRFATDYEQLVQNLETDLSVRGDSVKSRYGLGVGGEMQPYGEAGETEATRPPDFWEVAYPIGAFRSRRLYTEQMLVEATLAQLEKDIIQAAVENYETRRKMILRALMLKTNYNFDDGSTKEWPRSGFGTLGVKRLANNDGAVGEVWYNGAAVAIGTLQMYFGTNTATLTQPGFETAYAKLKSVGLAKDVVFKINPNDETAVRTMADFKTRQLTNIVNPLAIYAIVQSPEAIGRVEGTAISAEVQLEPMMPAGYFFAYSRAGGPEKRPVFIREHTVAQYRGWRLVQDETRASYGERSLRNKRWEYIAGAGVRNRVNGVAGQVVASTTYTDPTI